MLHFSGRSQSRPESVVLSPICLRLGRSDPGNLASPVLEASLSVVCSLVLVPICLAFRSYVSKSCFGLCEPPGTSPLPFLRLRLTFLLLVRIAFQCVWAYWSKKRLISVTVPPSSRTDSALGVSSVGTPRALRTVSFCAVHPPPIQRPAEHLDLFDVKLLSYFIL